MYTCTCVYMHMWTCIHTCLCVFSFGRWDRNGRCRISNWNTPKPVEEWPGMWNESWSHSVRTRQLLQLDGSNGSWDAPSWQKSIQRLLLGELGEVFFSRVNHMQWLLHYDSNRRTKLPARRWWPFFFFAMWQVIFFHAHKTQTWSQLRMAAVVFPSYLFKLKQHVLACFDRKITDICLKIDLWVNNLQCATVKTKNSLHHEHWNMRQRQLGRSRSRT